MQIRDRIIELARVPASELAPCPRNWRTHPDGQREALREMLAEIGYASAIVARRRDDGRLEIIDGHLRAETTPDQLVPVLVLDVTEAEADKLLLTLDPISAMAERDDKKWAALQASVSIRHPTVRKMLGGMRAAAAQAERQPTRELADIPETFSVLVECSSEIEQQAIYQRLVSDGLECRLLML